MSWVAFHPSRLAPLERQEGMPAGTPGGASVGVSGVTWHMSADDLSQAIGRMHNFMLQQREEGRVVAQQLEQLRRVDDQLQGRQEQLLYRVQQLEKRLDVQGQVSPLDILRQQIVDLQRQPDEQRQVVQTRAAVGNTYVQVVLVALVVLQFLFQIFLAMQK